MAVVASSAVKMGRPPIPVGGHADGKAQERAGQDGQRHQQGELGLAERELLPDGDPDDGEDHPHGEHHREPEGVHRQDAVALPRLRAFHGRGSASRASRRDGARRPTR